MRWLKSMSTHICPCGDELCFMSPRGRWVCWQTWCLICANIYFAIPHVPFKQFSCKTLKINKQITIKTLHVSSSCFTNEKCVGTWWSSYKQTLSMFFRTLYGASREGQVVFLFCLLNCFYSPCQNASLVLVNVLYYFFGY